MNSSLTRRIALIAGSAAIVGMGAFTAGCSKDTKEAPSTTSPATSASSTPAVTSTEKGSYNQPVVPSIEDRGGMDTTHCAPGQSKVNGVCK